MKIGKPSFRFGIEVTKVIRAQIEDSRSLSTITQLLALVFTAELRIVNKGHFTQQD